MTEKKSKNIFSRIFSTIKMALNGESNYDFTSGKIKTTVVLLYKR
jgi:hypothetical protein